MPFARRKTEVALSWSRRAEYGYDFGERSGLRQVVVIRLKVLSSGMSDP